jgi:hypothetical protein
MGKKQNMFQSLFQKISMMMSWKSPQVQVSHNLPEDLHDNVMDVPMVPACHVQDTSSKTVPLDLLEDIIEIPTDSAHFQQNTIKMEINLVMLSKTEKPTFTFTLNELSKTRKQTYTRLINSSINKTSESQKLKLLKAI